MEFTDTFTYTTFPLRDGQTITVKHKEGLESLLTKELLLAIRFLSYEQEKEFIENYQKRDANAGHRTD